MNNETQQDYLVLADISGYTSYLAGTELTHARDVLTELLELIVGHFKPLLNIEKLEGDAVFAYIPKAKIVRDETLLEMMESTYLAFKDRVEGSIGRMFEKRLASEFAALKTILESNSESEQ